MTSIDNLQTRDLTTDDLDAAFAVRSRSFGPLNPSMRDWWNDIQQDTIKEHRAIGVFDGERLLAQGKVRSYQQFWGGRLMPMGGVAGMVVAPEARGRGVGSQLMKAMAQRSRELGGKGVLLRTATESDIEPFLKGLRDRYAAQRANGPKLPTAAEAKEQLTDAAMMS